MTIINGIFQYARIEYAGFHPQGKLGAALTINLNKNGIYKYIQTSYSAGDGIDLNSGSISDGYIHYIIAYGCLGADFRLSGFGISAQYGLAIKDPYFADQSRGNGIVAANFASAAPINQLSNFTVIGYNPDARNLSNAGIALTSDAGSGVMIGNTNAAIVTGFPAHIIGTSDNFALYNSVIVGGWQSGVSINGISGFSGNNWDTYETSQQAGQAYVTLRNNYITGIAAALLPVRGGAFALQNYKSVKSGFDNIATSPKRVQFASFNDTTKITSFLQNRDDLGIKNLIDYQRLNNPDVLPAAGSILLKGASFPPGTPANSPFFDKNTTYVGAFGSENWTRLWSSFNPQINKY